jgi:hypothetical protein
VAPEGDSCGGISVYVLDYLDHIHGVAQVLHGGGQVCVVYHVKGVGKIEVRCIKILVVLRCILYIMDEIQDMLVSTLIGPKALLGIRQDVVQF